MTENGLELCLASFKPGSGDFVFVLEVNKYMAKRDWRQVVVNPKKE